MIWTSEPRSKTEAQAGITEHVLSLLSAGLDYFQARMELAGIESKDAFATYGKAIAFLVAAAALLLFGYIFLWIGIIAVVASVANINWGWIALGVGMLHIAGTVGLALLAKSQWGRPVFPATLREFRKDQEWLSSPKQTANRNS